MKRPALSLLALALLAAPAPSQTVTELLNSGDGLNMPTGVAVDDAGNCYVAAQFLDQVLHTTPDGIVTVLMGPGDGLDRPEGLHLDDDENLYVTCVGNNSVIKRTPAGVVTVLVDSTGDGIHLFDGPQAVTVDGDGNVYVCCWRSDNLFKVTPDGDVTQILNYLGDGLGNRYDWPKDVIVDDEGNVYTSGRGTHNVFKITPTGFVTQIISPAGAGGAAVLRNPEQLVIDDAGNVYVAGFGSDNVLRVTPGGTVTQFVGPNGDGQGHALDRSMAMDIDRFGSIYVTGQNDHAFKISPNGTVRWIFGNSSPGVSVIGQVGIAVTDDLRVYVSGNFTDNLFLATYPEPGTASCTGAAGCPCGNVDPDAGCANSTGTGGRLSGLGTASVAADDLVLVADGVPPDNSGLFYMGSAVVSSPFGDGIQCALGTTLRFLDQIQSSGAAGTLLLEHPAASSGGLITAGSTWHFHAWYRDVPGTPCGSGSNLTNLFSVTFQP